MAGRESKTAKRERAADAFQRLADTYPARYCFLDFETPFQLMIAVALSAQCTDAQVNRVTPRLFAKYPTPEALAEAPREDVERLIFSTGFYKNKAKHAQMAAEMVVKEFGGELPATIEELTRLPGVARKTANVVLTNAFGRSDGVCVDTHVGRVARRLDLTRSEDPVKVEQDLMALYPPETWGDIPFYFIYHGREICDARKPLCDKCPLADVCPKRGVGKPIRKAPKTRTGARKR